MLRRPPRSTLFPTRRSSDLDRLAAVTPRHEPPAPDAVARDRGDDRRALARPPLRARVGLPAGAGPVGPVSLAPGRDPRAGRRGADPREPDAGRRNPRAHDPPGAGVPGAGNR